IPDSEDVAILAAWSPVLRAPILWFGQLLALATLGAVIGWRRRPVRVLIAVVAGGGLAWVAASVRARQGRPVAIAAVIIVLVGFAAWYQPPWMAQRRVGSLAIGWHNIGAGFAAHGQREAARDAF